MKQAISLHMTGSSLLKSQLNLDICLRSNILLIKAMWHIIMFELGSASKVEKLASDNGFSQKIFERGAIGPAKVLKISEQIKFLWPK